MRHLRSLRLWFGVPAVLVGVAIGVLMNIATTSPNVPVVVGLVAAVAMLVGLTVWQAGRDEQDRLKTLRVARETLRAGRARVLKPLRPDLPEEHTISTLLAAEHALAPFRARHTETHALTRWCLDTAAPAVRVLAGPGGIGKSRLAVEVAGRLPDEWVTGRCVGGRAADLLPAVLACEEPTLVVVDDADTEPGVASLIEQLGGGEDRGRVKVLLLVRDAALFEHWVHQKLPDVHRGHLRTTPLAVVGAAGDRRRWFVEATRAYAAALGVAPPLVSDTDTRAVDTDGEAMVITQARAVLAALAGTRERADALRTAGIDRVAGELIEHERQRWNRAADDSRWGLPASLTVEARQEALLALALLAPATATEATGVLRRLPRFREDTDENLLRNIAAWAHHLYPGPGPAQVEPSPDFLRGALLAALTSPAHAEVTDSLLSALSTQQGSDVLTRLVRAAALFGTVAPLVGEIVHDQPALLGAAIESLVLTGPTAWSVERHLLPAIPPDLFSADEINRLIELLKPTQFNHLRAALRARVVRYARDALDKDDAAEARAALAHSLHNLGACLRDVGRYREALAALEEALGLWRDLAAQEPDRYTSELANLLNRLSDVRQNVGWYRKALAALEEALGLWRGLAAREPDRYTSDLANSLNSLGISSWEVGWYRKALAAHEEALGLRRDLVAQEPDQHTPDLAYSLHNLGVSLGEVGQHQHALAAHEEALGFSRDLAAQEPARHTFTLAVSLNSLGRSQREVGRHRDALAAFEEALGLRRGLAAQEPARHIPDLANSLTTMAVALCEFGRHDEELELRAEATVRWRILAQLDPNEHDGAYQRERDRLAASFSKHGHEPDAASRAEEKLVHRLGLGTPPPKDPT